MMLEERIARLNLERRAKIEARTNELHQEISPFGSLAKSPGQTHRFKKIKL
jgi:hypothetical protein